MGMVFRLCGRDCGGGELTVHLFFVLLRLRHPHVARNSPSQIEKQINFRSGER